MLLAGAVPVLFLHIRYQPGIQVPFGSTDVGFELSDFAVVVVALAALWQGVRLGFAPLRAGLSLWVVAGALLVWIAVRSETLSHAVTAAKFAEYALLAVSCPLLLRRPADWALVAVVASAWSAIATLVGVVQFFGVRIVGAWPAGWRQPSFLGQSDFAALSVLAFGVGLAALVVGLRRVGWLPLVVGEIGLILSGASAGLIGVVLGATALLWVARRRGALRRSGVAITCIAVALAAVGVLTIRAGDLDQFLRFLHVRRAQHSTTAHVQTYVQHTLLLYVGYRIWLTHPLVGAGWRQSSEPATVNPVLPAARREFPDVSPLALPTAAHEWGIQDAYVQAAADLGAIGFLLWLAAFAAAFALAIRAAAPPSESATFIVIAATGLWAGQGLVAGIPLDALTWLGFGLAATAAARASQYREPPVP